MAKLEHDAEKFLKDYRGHLQADAYVAYDSFVMVTAGRRLPDL